MACKQDFIRALAEYLVGDQVKKSMMLEMGDPDAKLWARIRGNTTLFGYPTVEKATSTLAEWLDVQMPDGTGGRG